MILHLRDCPPRPWKNGLGRTREIAVQTSASGDGFQWRVSIAEVDSAAPFSLFPGIDRTIVLLQGAGFVMTLDDGRVHALTTLFAPFAFAGEAQVAVTPRGGPTRDFNLMTCRAEACGAVEAWHQPGVHVLGTDTVLVYCARGQIVTPEGSLATGDAWRIMTPGPITLAGDAVALIVKVTSRAD